MKERIIMMKKSFFLLLCKVHDDAAFGIFAVTNFCTRQTCRMAFCPYRTLHMPVEKESQNEAKRFAFTFHYLIASFKLLRLLRFCGLDKP